MKGGSQVSAAIVSLVGLLLWNAISQFRMPNEPIQRVIDEIGASRHTENFITGSVSTSDIAFFVIASFTFLFIAARTLEARRWRV